MKAVVLKETRKIVVGEVSDAEMREPTDILLQLTSTAICGTDLHFYEGRMRGVEGSVIGHEPPGVVQEVGSVVKNVKGGPGFRSHSHLLRFLRHVCGGPYVASLTTVRGRRMAATGFLSTRRLVHSRTSINAKGARLRSSSSSRDRPAGGAMRHR